SHADERAALDRAAVHDRAMPDRDFLGHDGWPGVVGDMEHAVVLDVRPRSDADVIDVAAKDGAEPDRAVVADLDVADERGVLGDEHTLPEARLLSVERQDDHGARL